MLKGNHMSINPLACLRPPAVVPSDARAACGLSEILSAVQHEAALTDKISRHQSQRGGVRLAGGTCAWSRDAAGASGFGRRCCPRRLESGPDSGEVALGEILALRSLLLNLHFRAAKGEPMPEPEMRGLIERADGIEDRAGAGAHGGGSGGGQATVPEPETAAERRQRRNRRRAEHGGMGTQGVQQEVAEPDAGVDVDGDPADVRVLRRDADAGVRAELDSRRAAVPVGLPEERSAGQSIGDVGEQVHAAGGGGRRRASGS